MKILFSIPSLYGGGAEKVIKYLIENIQSNEKFLCTLEAGQKYDLEKNIKYIKLTNIDGRANTFKKITFFFIQYIKFIFLISKEKPDIIISFLERSNIITILTPIKTKKVISIRSFISKKFEDTGIKGKIVKFFYKFLFKRVNNFVVPTYEIKEDLIKNFKINRDNIKVIYNPIDLEKIDNLKNENLESEYFDLFKTNKILINVGNLTYPKGQWHLIKIFSKLKQKNNIKLVILGEGSYLDFLVKFALKLHMKVYDYTRSKILDNSYDIYFLGFKKNPYKFLYNSDIFIFSSLREGFPNALIEAMACELPVVSTNCLSGPKEILDNGKYGILLPVFSGNKNDYDLDETENKWIKVINSLLKQDLGMYKKLSIKRVREYELNRIIKVWEKYIKEQLK